MSIEQHEGKKYLRRICSPVDGTSIEIDVYAVLEAFSVTCPARAHAIKKLLCAGTRGKGDAIADLTGAAAAVDRAIQLEQQRKARVSAAFEDAELSAENAKFFDQLQKEGVS
jgi:hypothetical protein